MRLSVLLLATLALYLIPFGTQVYGSTDQCDLPGNQSCLQTSSNSQARSEAEPEIAQTPLILPDLSPTREDLDDTEADESTKTLNSDDNDGATASTSTDSDDDNDNADNSDDEREANNKDSKDSDEEDSENDDDGPSMIPFP